MMLSALRFLCSGLLAAMFLLPADRAAAEAVAQENAAWLRSIQPSAPLQGKLDAAIDRLVAADPTLRESSLRVAVIDLSNPDAPRLAERHGYRPVYPASVVKFVYLMAAYAWVDAGKLEIDPAFDRELEAMIYRSSNKATQKVLRKLTQTQAGPELSPADYAKFREKRLAVKRWLRSIGIEDLHTIHPTYDGGGDLYGRDRQLLADTTMPGALTPRSGEFANRQAMTAVETARLLALLATDRALSTASSATVRKRMHRDPRRQAYLRHRIAGGAHRCSRSLEIESKTGTYGRIIADAGIVRDESGGQMVVVVFVDSSPRYRGSFIADLSQAMSKAVLDCR